MAKPDPGLFHLALQRLVVPAHDAWHVGGSLAVDVHGAQRAGLFTVWLNRQRLLTSHTDLRPDLQISSLSEIASLLR